MTKVAQIKSWGNDKFYITTGGHYLLRNGTVNAAACPSGMGWTDHDIYTHEKSSWHKTLEDAVDTCDKYGYTHNYPELSKPKATPKKVITISYAKCIDGYFLSVGQDRHNEGVLYRDGTIAQLGYRGDFNQLFTLPTSTWHKTLDEAKATCKKYGYEYIIEGEAKPKKSRAKPKTYYKVVRYSPGDGFRSARRGFVEYKFGQWTTAPEGTKLFVFTDLQDARSFMYDEDRLFECKVKNPIKLLPSKMFSNIDQFWQAFNALRAKHRKVTNEAIGVEASHKYPSSHAVSAVKLTKEIK